MIHSVKVNLGDKIRSLEHPQSLKESISVTFIKIGAVISEISCYIVEKIISHLYLYTYRWIQTKMYRLFKIVTIAF